MLSGTRLSTPASPLQAQRAGQDVHAGFSRLGGLGRDMPSYVTPYTIV
jgi:hypothetical protein